MRILVIGLNFAPELVGIGPYTTGTVEALAAAGHDVRVIAGKPYYPAWKHDPAYARPWYHREVTAEGVAVLRCPHYVPTRPTAVRRILHHLSFAAAALWPALRLARAWRPQLVFTVAPSLMAVPVARAAARIAGARLWLHVQDFEVEAAFATGLVDAGGIGARIAQAFELRQLRAADRVSTISPRMVTKLTHKGVAPARALEFRNWADVRRVVPLTTPSPYRDRWRITERHVVLYSGNIALKQGVGLIVEAAALLRHRDDMAWIICGEGSSRAVLAAQVEGLPRVRLFDLQPFERLGDLLGLATVHLLPQIAGAADLVLPSKLTNMLASGRPVVATAMPGTGLADEVAGCGMVVPPGDARAFAAAIEGLIDDPARRATLGVAARGRAESRWARDAVLGGFVAAVAAMSPEAGA